MPSISKGFGIKKATSRLGPKAVITCSHFCRLHTSLADGLPKTGLQLAAQKQSRTKAFILQGGHNNKGHKLLCTVLLDR